MDRIRLVIYGSVQGVGFRFSVIEVANELGLVGWVRNNSDGSVEIVAEGPRGKLEKLASWSKKGPFLAEVEKVESFWEKTTGEFSNFDAKY
jgi:acylphosphatase